MKTLYLHIGTMKTGTTSFQQFLYRNRKVLEKKGYLFPIFDYQYTKKWTRSKKRNAMFMSAPLFTKKRERDHEAEHARFYEGMAVVAEAFRKYDNVILTDEVIWTNAHNFRPELWQELKQYADEHDFTVKIIVYFRRQDVYLDSYWNHTVKRLYSRDSFQEFLVNKLDHATPDYAEGLKKILEYFPKESLVVHRFERSSFPEGNVIYDFLEILGLKPDEGFSFSEKNANERLSANMVQAKLALNMVDGINPDEMVHFEKACLMVSNASDELYHADQITTEEKRALVESYQEGNAWIAEEFFHDGKPLFRDDYPENEVFRKDNPYETDDIVRFASSSDILLYRKIKELEQEHLKAKKELEAKLREARKAQEKAEQELQKLKKLVEKETKKEQEIFGKFPFRLFVPKNKK